AFHDADITRSTCVMKRPPKRETFGRRSEEHTSELQSREKLVCRLLLEKKRGPSVVARSPDRALSCGTVSCPCHRARPKVSVAALTVPKLHGDLRSGQVAWSGDHATTGCRPSLGHQLCCGTVS